jgi:O-acetyl-ADP-ribose deacetylase
MYNRVSKTRLEGKYENVSLIVVQNDITNEKVDAIVNAANTHLAHGGGVAGAISSRGGHQVQRESDEYVRKNGPVRTGEVGYTSGANLDCKYIIHAVGPIYSGHEIDDELLRDAVYNSFLKAHQLNCRSIAIPAISSGIFGYPKPRCAKVMIKTAKEFVDYMKSNSFNTLQEIRFVNFDTETSDLMENELKSFLNDPSKEIALGTIEKKNRWFDYGKRSTSEDYRPGNLNKVNEKKADPKILQKNKIEDKKINFEESKNELSKDDSVNNDVHQRNYSINPNEIQSGLPNFSVKNDADFGLKEKSYGAKPREFNQETDLVIRLQEKSDESENNVHEITRKNEVGTGLIEKSDEHKEKVAELKSDSQEEEKSKVYNSNPIE